MQLINTKDNAGKSLYYFSIILLMLPTHVIATTSSLLNPLPALTATELGLIVNDSSPFSIKIGKYYQQKRNIPEQNIIHINFDPAQTILSVEEFKQIKQEVDIQTPQHIQAYALTWATPYRVDCMSITTAFAAGFNDFFCALGCNKTSSSPYYNSNSSKPFTDYKWRPTMALAGSTFAEVKSLIDRGIASDYTHPTGTGYLLETSDKERSSRATLFPRINDVFKGLWPVKILKQDTLENKQDVMFYFTGKKYVEKIQTNQFLPGAVADHLTSFGGVLQGSSQMSSLQWLKSGTTGSYGTVIEPCNFIQKFPNPKIMMSFYIKGNTLIEAYWKSVEWPGQGLFIGEPLAKPFAYKKTITIQQ